jgi:hypothetical protein
MDEALPKCLRSDNRTAKRIGQEKTIQFRIPTKILAVAISWLREHSFTFAFLSMTHESCFDEVSLKWTTDKVSFGEAFSKYFSSTFCGFSFLSRQLPSLDTFLAAYAVSRLVSNAPKKSWQKFDDFAAARLRQAFQ